MELIISFAIAYFLTGVSFVVQDLGSSPKDKPVWASNPTVAIMLLICLIWPIRSYINFARGNVWRGLALMLYVFFVQMVVVTILVSLCITISFHLFHSTIFALIVTLILILVGTVFVLPLLNLIMIPLTLLFVSLLSFLFSSTKNKSHE